MNISAEIRLIVPFFIIAYLLCCSCSCIVPASKGCNHVYGESLLVSIIGSYELEIGSQGLDSNVVNQIDTSLLTFSKLDYIWFSGNPYMPRFRGEWSSVTQDIYVDTRLLNYFTFIFTDTASNEILGHIRQIQSIDSICAECDYYIPYEDIKQISNRSFYDIYGFHNDTLVLKKSY